MLMMLSGVANSAAITFLWDYQSPTLTGITTIDGSIVQSSDIGMQYLGNYVLFNSQTLLSDLDFSFNILDGIGNLLHTWEMQGAAGSSTFTTPFLSTEAGALTSLAGGTDIVANGNIQTVGSFFTGDDVYTLQFRTNLVAAAVPNISSIALLGLGLACLGLSRKKLKR
ncbi:hypothetical protein [Alteromonas sp. M12]|uniref:hypothetical protein n=1 Tax=Alteromonas sp. M12 TaxID=3135644 RepID=UPI00319D941C